MDPARALARDAAVPRHGTGGRRRPAAGCGLPCRSRRRPPMTLRIAGGGRFGSPTPASGRLGGAGRRRRAADRPCRPAGGRRPVAAAAGRGPAVPRPPDPREVAPPGPGGRRAGRPAGRLPRPRLAGDAGRAACAATSAPPPATRPSPPGPSADRGFRGRHAFGAETAGRSPTDPPPTPSAFATATAVERAEGSGLAAVLDPGWDVGAGILNGGYLLAVAARAAAFDSPHPHPVALSASYLRATGPGPVTLTVTPGPPAGRWRTPRCCSATPSGPTLAVQATTATLVDEPPVYADPLPDVPPVEECLAADAGADLGGRPVPEVGLRRQVETRLDPATAGWALGQPSGEPVMRGYVRLTDGSPPGPVLARPLRRRPAPDQLGPGPVRLVADRAAAGADPRASRTRLVSWWSRGPARWPAAGSTRTTGSGTRPAGWSRRAASSPACLADTIAITADQASSLRTVAGSARSAARWA